MFFLISILKRAVIRHAEMKGVNTSAVEMIKALGSRQQTLHIHDNDKHHDSHQIPGSMKIDFAGVVQALKEIGYSGYFTLEADCYLKKYDAENVYKGMKELADSARRLADMFESHSTAERHWTVSSVSYRE